MRSDSLVLARQMQHEQLRQYRHALQPDAKRPQHLSQLVAIGKEDPEHPRGGEQVLHLEGVDVGVVGRAVVGQHEVEGVGLGGEEEEFEGRVVEGAGCEGPEDVWAKGGPVSDDWGGSQFVCTFGEDFAVGKNGQGDVPKYLVA